MEFWHAAFLAGTATFAIPVVIHLMFRMRKRRLVFSSLRFLQQSVLRQSHRLRLRELLLLLLRCAACIFIALAFSRPFRSDSALAGAGGRIAEDVVLVLDDSPSVMAQEGASVRWLGLLDKARREVAQHPSGDRVALVLTSDSARAEIELSSNFGAVLSALQREKASPKRGDLAQALNTAIELLVTSTQPARRIVVYSDLQANQIDRGAWAEAAQKAAAAGRGITVQIEAPSDAKPGRLSNLAVTEVRPKSDVWIEGRPVPFAVRVSNYGDGEHPSVAVKLMVDGKPAATRTVALGPRSSAEFEMTAPFPRGGEVSGSVELEGADVFPDDDKRLFALHLRDSLKALVVEERLNEKDFFLDEGYYVRMALDPKARAAENTGGAVGSGAAATGRGAEGAQSYVQVQSITASQLTPEVCRRCDLIILAGISALKDTELATLEEAVADGRNLILFTGRSDGRISETFYNGPFWKSGLGLLPARPGPLYEGNPLERKYHKLGDFKVEHPLFKTFTGENEVNLRLPRYVRHFQANPADLKIGSVETKPTQTPSTTPVTTKVHPAGEVLANFGDGTPFVMERPYGKGVVLMFNFAPRPESTDLPKRKAFVPLLHQAVRHLAGVTSTARRNLIVGEQFDFADAGATPETTVTLEKPGVKKETLAQTGKDHPTADVPGIYTAAFAKGNMTEKTLWAVNLDARESDLNSEDLATLRAVFTSNTVDKSTGKAGLTQAPWDDEQKAQAPDWRYFLVAALACLLLELWLRDYWHF